MRRIDTARGPQGQRQTDRRLLFVSAVLIGVLILAVFPFRLLPAPWWADTALHFTAGVALTLFLAASVPRRDDALMATVVVAGVLFEPGEWSVLTCQVDIPVFAPEECKPFTLTEWMMRDDTLKDMGYVALGAALTLVGLDRYR